VTRDRSQYAPAILVGGVIAGVLSSIPIVNYANCVFCLWMILGAGLSVFLIQQKTQSVDVGEGALIGALAGVVCGFTSFVLLAALYLVIGASILGPAMSSGGGGGGDEMLAVGGSMIVGILVMCAIQLFIYPLFGALGGMLCAAIFKPALRGPAARGDGPFDPPGPPSTF